MSCSASNSTTGCLYSFQSTFEQNLGTIGAAGLVIGVLEFIGLILSVLLFRKIAKKQQQQESLLNEAWRINKSTIQYGNQTFQYI